MKTPPIEIYRQAVLAMHEIQAPAFLAFDTHVTTTVGEAVSLQHVRQMERTSDHTILAHLLDETKRGRVEAEPFVIAPDLLLGHVDNASSTNSGTLKSGLDDIRTQPLRTIAVVNVAAVHYSVTIIGEESLPTCASTIHVNLKPLQEPRKYNLRELWVDETTSRICKAVAVWRGHVNRSKVEAAITLDLDEHGLIDHFDTTVSARFFIGGNVSVHQESTYDAPTAVEEPEWTAFSNEKDARSLPAART